VIKDFQMSDNRVELAEVAAADGATCSGVHCSARLLGTGGLPGELLWAQTTRWTVLMSGVRA
jgi:hypothetical protein